MSLQLNPQGSRLRSTVLSTIVECRPWIARSIINNNLRQHCHLLARTFRPGQAVNDPIRAPSRRLLEMLAAESNILTDFHPSVFPLIPVLVKIAAYADRWIRDPEDWPGMRDGDPRTVIRSLVEHLFSRWKMPAFFDSAWTVKGELNYLERDWYCHLAAGGSLRKVQGMPPSLTSRALHLAMNAPRDLTIRQALRWGQVKALNGSDELLQEVLRSRMVVDLSNDVVWSRLLQKVISCADFQPRHFGIIADTLLEVIANDGWPRAEILVGVPVKELLAYCRRFWSSLLRSAFFERPGCKRNDIHCAKLRMELKLWNSVQWASLVGSKPFQRNYQSGGRTYLCRIVELTRHWQLEEESFRMKHCVDTYGHSCKRGWSSIFSLRTEETVDGKTLTTSHITIEVYRKTRRIVQVRGKRNQYIDASRVPLLCEWARELDLKM